MSLDKLDYILAVAEAQTLTRAAQQLYVSQPTLTNYINKLEETLGVKLFDRNVTPIQVTPAGSLYIARMTKLQHQYDILLSELRYMSEQQTILNIGIGSTRGDHWLPKIVPDFRKMHPNVVLEFHEKGEEDLENGLLNGTIDIAIGVLNPSLQGITYQNIIDEPVYLAIPREFECVSHFSSAEATIENPSFISGSFIKNVPFLLPTPGNGFYRCAQSLLQQADVNPVRVLSYKNMNTAYQLASLGVGAIFITAALFDLKYPDCKEKLAFCTLQQPVHLRTCVAGYRKDNKNLELISNVIDIVKQNIVPMVDNK